MYSRVSKYSPEARKKMPYRSSKGKSCGYYMRIVFFFSSLIQSLIIVSLVLFLIYGKQQDSTSVGRVQDLELRFSQLSMETVSLRLQRKNLTHLLNVTSMEKARNEWDLAQLRAAANISFILLEDTGKKLHECNLEKMRGQMNCQLGPRPPMSSPIFNGGCNCGLQMETLRAKMDLVQSNFTQTAMQMQMEMDQMAKDRDNLNLEVIQLRRDKSVHEKAIQFYQIKCKEEFVNSLSGISNVSKAFLTKIDSLFHSLSPFHITCPKQKEYLDQIRTNCTDLSEDVVTKFQTYLDLLGDRVSMYQGNISVLTAENMRMTRDYTLCSQNRTGLIREHKQHIQRVQLQHDDEKEKLLKEKLRLKGEIDVMESNVKLKNSQLEHMNEQLRTLNMSCIPRTGGLFPRFGNQPGSSWGSQAGSSNPSFSSSPGGVGQFNRHSFGSSLSSSSSSSHGTSYGLTNTNTGLSSSKQSFSGLGSSSQGTNSGLGSSTLSKPSLNNPGSSSFFGSSSSGTGSTKQTSTGLGSSSSFFGSSSSGTGSNKQTSTGLGSSSSSSYGSSLGSSKNPSSSSSSQNKFGSSGGTGSSSSNLGSNFGSSSSSLGSNSGSSSSSLVSSSNSGLGSSSSSKTTSNSRGSSNSLFGSSSSSSSSSLGSSSLNQNKLSSSPSKSSSSTSSSSSSSTSSGTSSKSGFGWWGLGGGSSSSSTSSGSTTSDQSKLGSSQGRGSTSSGTSFGSLGSGKTNSFSFTGPLSVNQHLRDLQRLINPPGPEEKQELSRMMG